MALKNARKEKKQGPEVGRRGRGETRSHTWSDNACNFMLNQGYDCNSGPREGLKEALMQEN